MQKNRKFDKENMLNIVKLVGGVIVFYFGLKLFVPTTQYEDFVSENFYEGFEGSVEYEMDDEFKNELGIHNVSDEKMEIVNLDSEVNDDKCESKINTICYTNNDFCKKIIFSGVDNSESRYMYLASSIYVLNFIDNNIKIGLPIKKQLKSIAINNTIGNRRGYANWTNVNLNLGSVKSYAEFLEVISHELGHIVDLGVVKGYSTEKDKIYTEFGKMSFAKDDPSLSYYKISWDSETVRKSSASVSDFCSSYGMTDPFEDFAECHNLYLNHNAIFKAWAKNNESMKKKYNFFANLYGGKYMFTASSDLNKYDAYSATRPWDTTKM